MKEEKKREYGEATLTLNREIKKTVDKLAEESGVSCALVSTIEKKVGKDPRTVKFHLKLLEQAEYGKFSKDGKLFCPSKTRVREQKDQ